MQIIPEAIQRNKTEQRKGINQKRTEDKNKLMKGFNDVVPL